MATTSSLWSTQIEVGSFSTADRWATCPLTTLENALNNTAYVPALATVTQVVLKVRASWWCGSGASANGYIKYGFGGTESISKELLGKTKIDGGANADNIYDYPSGGVDITSLLTNKSAQSVALTRDYGSYLTFCFISANIAKKTFHVKEVTLDITYTAHSHSYVTTYTWGSDGKSCTAKRTCSCGSTESSTATITSAIKTAATCTSKGTTRYTAKFSVSWASTQTKDVQDIAAKGHSWTAATCTTPKTCSVCGATEGSALGHNYTSSVVAPTETSHGYTRHTCSHCGHYYDTDITYLVSVAVSPAESGYVDILGEYTEVENGFIVADGVSITLFATANEEYEFLRWSDGIENDHRLITVTSNATYTAIFEKIPPPEITSVQMLYSNKQISAANKVPAGEFFRIVVGAVAYDS